MAYAWEKYKLTLSGMEIAVMGNERTKRVIEVWAAESGVKNVKNHRIDAEVAFHTDEIFYTASVDSAGWTG